MINIRPMETADLKQVANIEKSIFSIPWSEAAFAQALSSVNTTYLVAEYKGDIAGYCGMYRVLNEGDITNVAVKCEYRRRGIAEQLVTAIIKSASEKGVENITLEVRESNNAAIGLYNKIGFKEEGIRKNFYEKPLENAIIMWKMNI